MKEQTKKLMAMVSKALSVESNSLEFCKVDKRSYKDLGFVIHDTWDSANHYYLHTGKGDAGLTIGDGLLCLVALSKHCSDRLDIEEYLPVSDTKDLVGELIERLDPPWLLHMFQRHWFRQHIVSHFYSKLFDRIVKNELTMTEIIQALGKQYDFPLLVEYLKDDPRYSNLFRCLSWPNLLALLRLPDFQLRLTSKDHQHLWQCLINNQASGKDLLSAVENGAKKELFRHLPFKDFANIENKITLDEEQYCRYVIEFFAEDNENNQQQVTDTIKSNNMMQARLLLALHNFQLNNNFAGFSNQRIMPMLTNLFDHQFLRRMFEAHANERKPIKNLLWHQCSPSSRSGTLTACEGKIVNSNRDYRPVKVTMCRNRKCDKPGFSLHSDEAHLYNVLKKWFDLDCNLLHTNETFTRSIAAMNLWNQILKRLICKACNDPLEYSEHNPNSMGKMAYGVSYWHCGNSSCDKNNESIKITQCIGCGQVIDSREDTRACNPYELHSYRKFYICTSCGSCCNKHKWLGICPMCGGEHVFHQHEKLKGIYQCRSCEHTVKPPLKFKSTVQKMLKGTTHSNAPQFHGN